MRLFAFILAALAVAAGAALGQVTSGDGAWIGLLEAGGHELVIAEAASGADTHRRALVSRDGTVARGAALIAVPARRSFVIALEGFPELWEVALDPGAGPFHDGFVHSYEAGMEESLAAEEGLFARQRIVIDAPVTGLAPMPGKRYAVVGTRADGRRAVINLAVKREIAVLPPE